MRRTDLTILIEQGMMQNGPARPRTTADQARIRKLIRARRALAA